MEAGIVVVASSFLQIQKPTVENIHAHISMQKHVLAMVDLSIQTHNNTQTFEFTKTNTYKNKHRWETYYRFSRVKLIKTIYQNCEIANAI